ncbi:arogenate dehydrogenase [Oceanobacillus picturae]|uniref:Prephenate dehydrogenase n=1 Tax=Oceanobacillus picturae TaxID=171693 RepID=W9AGJ1_9BACI|nr:prephenate dehydrogenase [Oceanobacillus picturae]GAQ17443.1 arogenate dehydrogenase [Oceanobacillus picturae]CDO02042.1 Arogenate dehydrogenase [Oceanobacillus picturae]
MKQVIVVAGLGLIGGSIAKSVIRDNGHYVIGYDTNNETLQFALEMGIIHEAATDLMTVAKRADYIILAAPISETIRLMELLDNVSFEKDIIITDVSSVKRPVMEAAENLVNPHLYFIGGHPMAGSHKKGVQAAKAHLFENAIYVLVSGSTVHTKQVKQLKEILSATNCKFIELNATEHDEMTGVVSHFPHLIASSLVHQARKWQETHQYLPNLAAGGFRDITRIASSNPVLWQDIFHHNREKMVQLLDEWIKEMSFLKQLVEQKDRKTMISYLEEAQEYRDGLGKKEKGAIPSYHDLYVDIRDQTGAIASVTQLLAEHSISINNIQILEIREGITGALRLSFSSQTFLGHASQLLRDHGYETMVEK